MTTFFDFEHQIRRLLIGLADQAIKDGHVFKYDNAVLLAEDVAEIAGPTALCMAQDLACRIGMSGFGLEFKMGSANPVFPIHFELKDHRNPPRFMDAAPWITEIFDGELMSSSHDLAKFYEVGAKLLRNDFDLEVHSNYRAPKVHDVSEVPPQSAPGLY